jgi:hypothetical protein
MWSLFQRRPKAWKSLSGYYRSYERELKRNPLRFEEEQKQGRQWAVRAAQKNRLKRIVRPLNEQEELKAIARGAALTWIKGLAKDVFMQDPAATDEDFRKCWPSIRQELIKRYMLEELERNPPDFGEIAERLRTENRRRNTAP